MLTRLFAVLLLITSFAARADDDLFLHVPTGVKLPQVLHDFKRGKIDNNEASQVGQGVAVHYERLNSYNATLFIYNKGLQPFPESVEDPAIVSERERAAQALLLNARNREPTNISANARRSFGMSITMPTVPNKTNVLWDQFVVYIGGRATNDALYIWVAKNHIWKLRLTRVPGADIPNVNPFVTALVQLSVGE